MTSSLFSLYVFPFVPVGRIVEVVRQLKGGRSPQRRRRDTGSEFTRAAAAFNGLASWLQRPTSWTQPTDGTGTAAGDCGRWSPDEDVN